MKKISAILLTCCISLELVLSSINVYAFDNTKDVWDGGTLEEVKEQFSKMTNEELNEYISGVCAEFAVNTNKVSVRKSSIYSPIQQAWLAAAAIARNSGYPCAAKLVEYSVMNINYTENGGDFAKKIKTTTKYKKWTRDTKTKELVFEKNDSNDLFYALHRVNISLVASGSNGAKILVSDKFDFAYDNKYDSLFTSTVNNWAWLCQQTSVLNKIQVSIVFYA